MLRLKDGTMKVKKIVLRTFAVIGILVFIAFSVISGPYLWKHWVTYPRLEKERQALWLKYKMPQKYIDLEAYKGVFHMHSYWSHDSRGRLNEIYTAAKKAGFSFLFFSDHPHAKLDTFPRSYHGIYKGIVFEPGTESSSGLMVTPLDTVVLDWSKGDKAVIHQVVSNGGLVLYVHTEKKHDWDNPDYQGMEIYNIHTDFLDGNDGLFSIILNVLFNGSKYHHWVFREIYDEQTEILANWDRLNEKRLIVAVSAVDAHNNQSFRARYTKDGKVEWVGPNAETLAVVEPGLKEKILLGKPDENGWAFKWEVDPYYVSFNHVANHVFSEKLTARAIKNNLTAGHEFISFQSLAKADEFQYFCMDKDNQISGILGDSVAADQALKLKAVSPLPVRFELVKDGKLIDSQDNVYEYLYNINNKKGNYRIVAKLYLDGAWVSWVFTNPIYVY